MTTQSQRLTKIAKYDIKRRIGSGAMGVVYEAFDPFVQRTVAIKVAYHSEDIDEITRQKMLERFFAEVYSAGRMHHPSVISVYDAGQEGEDLFATPKNQALTGLPKFPVGWKSRGWG